MNRCYRVPQPAKGLASLPFQQADIRVGARGFYVIAGPHPAKPTPVGRTGLDTPTLSGVGELAHLATPELGIEEHVRDVIDALETNDLLDAIRVCHSYGGIVIGAAAHRAPERVAHLVYLEALVPQDNAAAADVAVPGWIELAQVQADESGDGWLVPPPDVETPFGITDPADAEWVRANLTPQPLRTWTERVRLTDSRAESISKTYIRCPLRNHPGPDTLSHHAEAARRSPTWRYREPASDHDPMITHPRELADLLLEVA